MSSSRTGRYDSIMGKNYKSVQDANKIVSRFTLLLCVALSRGVHWLDSRLNYYWEWVEVLHS